MRITWNTSEKSFDAHFVQGAQWKLDQEAVRLAGFKCAGPPAWQWFTQKIEVLLKLKAAGADIDITPEALAVFQDLKKQADIKADIMKQFETAKAIERGTLTPDQKLAIKVDREAKRAASGKPKKERVLIARGGEKKDYTPDLSQLATMTYFKFVPPAAPELLCIFCKDPVYFYEVELPAVCLWCEKVILDKNRDKTLDKNVNVELI